MKLILREKEGKGKILDKRKESFLPDLDRWLQPPAHITGDACFFLRIISSIDTENLIFKNDFLIDLPASAIKKKKQQQQQNILVALKDEALTGNNTLNTGDNKVN